MRQKTNNTFYGGITVLIVACSFVYSWKFLVPKYNSQKTEINTVDTELKAATNKLESIKTTRTTLETLKPITNQLFIAVPGDKDSPNLITELEAIALKYKIIIPSIQIADGAKAATGATGSAPISTNAVSISIAVNGSFADLNSFVGSLEKDIRFMNIKSLSMTSTDDPTKMSLTLQIEAYKRPAVAATSAATATPSVTTNTSGAE